MRRRAKVISTRRAKDWDAGLYVSYCPNQNMSLTQHPSDFPASVVESV
jgi:hypothetical protein